MEAKNYSRWFAALVVGGGLLLRSLASPAPLTAQNGPPASTPTPTVKDGPSLEPERAPPKIDSLIQQAVQKQDQPELPPPQKSPATDTGDTVKPPNQAIPENRPTTKPATVERVDEVLPISLPATLRLTNTRAWDIIIAQQQLQIAAAQLQGANVLWLPTLVAGPSWQHTEGPIQNTDGSIMKTTNSSMFTGAAPVAIFAMTDAIFTPLAQRQVVRAQAANIQTATNDTLTEVAQRYFDSLESRADLAGIEDVNQRAVLMVKKAESLVPGGLIPPLEVYRVRAAKANFEQVVESARQRWRDTSADVARLARLKPNVLVQPMEPAQLRVTLVPPNAVTDELIPVALATRPELTFEEAQAEAARERLRQERFRPFLPSIVVEGGGPSPYTVGAFGGGQGSTLNNFNLRSDWNLEAYWELRNLGFGNRALIRERRAEYDLARSQEYRFRDLVAAEVTQAWADVQSANRRVDQAERELREALGSATLNLESLGETKRAQGNIIILVIRPLEVVAALQALQVGYFDYFGAVADYNRAQFRLYRALGNPAQYLAGRDGVLGPPLPEPGPAPALAPVPVPGP